MENFQQEEQDQNLLLQEMFIELTPEQEAEQLTGEFAEFAAKLEGTLPFIPEDKAHVKTKVEALVYAFGGLGTEDILVLFQAMDKAYPDEFTGEEVDLGCGPTEDEGEE